jgi:hypothetical protein
MNLDTYSLVPALVETWKYLPFTGSYSIQPMMIIWIQSKIKLNIQQKKGW